MGQQENNAENSRIAALEQQVAALMAALNAQQTVNTSANEKDVIKIVHLVERNEYCSTLIRLSNLVISMTRFGEERRLTVQQFEELISRYRDWFDNGTIAVASGYEEYAERYGLRTAKKFPMNTEFIKNLGRVSMTQLEETFTQLPQAGQESIVSYWIHAARKGDPAFRDIRKLETLNRVSGGKMGQFIAELNQEDRMANN